MKHKLKYVLFICIVITDILNAQVNPTIGSGYCLDFTPNMSNNNHVDLGNLSAINTSDFTVEMWLNVNNCMNDPAFFSNKDWSSGSNTGINMDIHDNGNKLRVNFKAPNGTVKNLIVPINAIGRGWFHLSATFKRNGYLKIYINGVIKDSINISAATGSLATTYTYKLGQDGTGDYTDNGTHIRYDGKMDDVRIWNYERTEQDIRIDMCKKLLGNETGLYSYYNCDSTSGNKLRDLKGINNGIWKNTVASNWKVSGAPIGNESIQLYPALSDWSGEVISLTDPTYGNLIVDSVSGASGIHIYKVNSLPNSSLSLNEYPSNFNYYGVFLTDVSDNTAYKFAFDYAANSSALADKMNLKLFTRNQNSDLLWSEYFAKHDTVNHLLLKKSTRPKGEFILGSKQGINCNPPSLINMVKETDSSFTIGWTGGGSGKWNTQWGLQGFTLGTGNSNTNTTVNPKTLIGLTPNFFYEFYVQDTCNGNGSSYWLGPFTFSNRTCASSTSGTITSITSNSALLSWNGIGTHFDIQWGLKGFLLGTGIPHTTITPYYALTGLQGNTAYSFYVRTNCGDITTTNYSGPYTFTTLLTVGIKEENYFSDFSISPNPNNGEFKISASVQSSKINVSIFNLLGEEILQVIVQNNNGKINQVLDLKTFPAGIYMVRISDGKEIFNKRLVIQ